MHTEEQAREKWCPFARAIVLGTGDFGDFQLAINRTDRGGASLAALCIASDCMAWRWKKSKQDNLGTWMDPTHGYCGLAGAPK